MRFPNMAVSVLSSIILFSCVSNSKFERAQKDARSIRDSLNGVNSNLLSALNICKDS